MLPAAFDAFVKASPVSVMVRGLLERFFHPAHLDAWFDQTASAQYTRELTFSTVFDLMFSAVTGNRKSLNRAYAAQSESIPVSIATVYDKLNGIELTTSAALVSYSAMKASELMEELNVAKPVPLSAPYALRLLDGNCLKASEKRLKPLRGHSAAALPGKSLVIYDPAWDLVPLCRWTCSGAVFTRRGRQASRSSRSLGRRSPLLYCTFFGQYCVKRCVFCDSRTRANAVATTGADGCRRGKRDG